MLARYTRMKLTVAIIAAILLGLLGIGLAAPMPAPAVVGSQDVDGLVDKLDLVIDRVLDHLTDRIGRWSQNRISINNIGGGSGGGRTLIDFRPTFHGPGCIGAGISVCDPIRVNVGSNGNRDPDAPHFGGRGDDGDDGDDGEGDDDDGAS